VVVVLFVYPTIAHFLSYNLLKNRIIKRQKWDLNICCGQTDGKGINADIVPQKNIPNFHLIEDIYHLPFKTGQFNNVLCSHTIEHVDDPGQFFKELKRVGKKVTIVIPPLYDITAALNIFEHQYIFFSFKKVHHQLPKYTKLPLAASVQKRLGQLNHSASSSPSIPLVFQLIFFLFSASHRDQIKLKNKQ
jgi:SAM-dependent methyltransferase